jgi:hypothetical protein
MTYLGEKEYCRGGCGRLVLNRSGYCLECRTQTCTKCGAKFAKYVRNENPNICTKCHRSEYRSLRAKRAAVSIGGNV